MSLKQCGAVAVSVFLFTGGASALASSENNVDTLCNELDQARKNLKSYQCIYKARVFHEGKPTETLLRYSYIKPNKVRMDIQRPKKGAVLIYNPLITDKVRIRPFPHIPFFVLKYDLNHKRVSTDEGGTIDRSDLGSRMRSLCKELKSLNREKNKSFSIDADQVQINTHRDGRKFRKIYRMDQNHLLIKITIDDGEGNVHRSFEWLELKTNIQLSPSLFEKF